MDLGLDIVDCVRGLNLKGDGFTREGLDEDLHDEDLEVLATATSRSAFSHTSTICLPQPFNAGVRTKLEWVRIRRIKATV